ncbi:MAG: type II secretion system protein [Patescibacteria group bacterium]|nr:type II secretion system protein [Patescibacteria group bacterium]
MPKARSKNLGFTLVELLVVIAITGFLVTTAVVTLSNARIKARDARRISDIRQLQKALEMYYDQNNAYPISTSCGAVLPTVNWCNSSQTLSNGHWIKNNGSGPADLNAFLSQDPLDPRPVSPIVFPPSNGGNYFYFDHNFNSNNPSGRWYIIVFSLEDKSNSIQNSDGVTLCDGTYVHYGNGSNGIITVGGNCIK